MQCDKCGFKNEENLKYCGNCGNKLAILKPAQILKNEIELNKDPYAKNYKKIFSICLYSVIGCVIFIIFLSFFIHLNWAGFIGTIFDIFFNIWIWIFIIFISIFRKNHKAWALVVSIIFGFITIIAAISSLIYSAWPQVLK